MNATSTSDPRRTAVIKESLRLYTPNTMPMERVAPYGFFVDGHLIPAKTVVSIHPYMTHRDPQVYGEDATLFRPERWLEADNSSAKLMERNFLVVSPHSITSL
jgi:cytochrome P450